jgi:3-phosphoshikimate 1-carboxyvinyltransferase
MSCKIEKSKLSGKIVCPANKSYTHRAIMLASLAKGKSIIKNVLSSSDINATINACKSFGAQITETEEDLTIKGVTEFKNHDAMIDAMNSGTTIRIAAAIASLYSGKTTLSGDDSLQKRPMQPLLDALESIGAKCSSTNGKPPITVTGIARGGKVNIQGNISSQFVTALMIIAPLTEKGLVLSIEGDLVSKPYLDATINIMKKFGAKIDIIFPYQKYQIFPQNYKPTTVTIPSDFSSMGLLLSAAVLLGDELTFEMTKGDLPQGDEKIIDILKILGVDVNVGKNTISVKSPQKLKGGKFDLNNTPDLLPPLAILALKTLKPIEIFNVKHARYKETDRIAVLARELKKLGIKVKENEDGLILESPDSPKSAELISENDHRLFMAFCIAGMYIGDCSVTNPESVEISYPNFISDMNKVGGKIKFNL